MSVWRISWRILGVRAGVNSSSGSSTVLFFFYPYWIQIGFNVEYHSIVDEQIDSALAWSLLLSKTIFVMTVVKMLWAHEAQPTANKPIRLRHYCLLW